MTERSFDGLPVPRRYFSILAVMLGNSAVVLDATAVNIALPHLAEDFSVAPAEVTLIVTVYQVIIISTLLQLSSLGEIFGFKKLHLLGVALFGLGALASASASGFTMLLIGRAFQALGTACVMSMNIALVRTSVPPHQLGRTIGFGATAVAISAASGPVLAGLLLSVFSWRAIFLIGAPAAVATLLLGLWSLPRNDIHAVRKFDIGSAILSALAFGLGFTGISRSVSAPALQTSAMIGAALVCFVLLIRRQRGDPEPILPVDLLANPVVAVSIGASVCNFIVEMLSLVSLPFILRDVFNLDAAASGLLFGVWSITVAVIAPVVGHVADRVPPGPLGGFGMMMMAAGLALLVTAPADADFWQLAPRMAMCGFGLAIFVTPNNRMVISSAPHSRSGSAGGALAAARLTGQTIGTSIAAFALAFQAPTLALEIGCGVALLAAVLSMSRGTRK